MGSETETSKVTQAQRREMVWVLGIDEISLKKRHKQFGLVISDLERRCVMAVLPGREKERLEKCYVCRCLHPCRREARHASSCW
jgi:transposase